ncbi:secretory carrier-associated membrane protein 3 isoform X2 [Emydura macquarii macquarii]|uniref:secretory carrier-associated membrane protein 3 isoform X2 n=1 Tax=Emydura macquarii macquarii TaxID=1129001 RepID=UPI00352A0DFD
MAQNGAGSAGNPFGEPDNPFQDPAVMQHKPSTEYATLDVYNPFENREPPPPYQPPPGAQPTPPVAKVPQQPASAMQPPKKLSPSESKNYGSYGSQASTAAAAAELLKRQEELNRKAEELDRRERELQNAALGSAAVRQNNWPPLPSFCPMKPCFYQDIPVEIPTEFQKTVSSMYYLWMGCCVCAAGHRHPGLGIQWLDSESDCAEEQPGCSCNHDPGGCVLHSGGHPGDHPAEEDPLPVPPDGCQLPEGTGGVCRRRLLEPGGAHGSGQCCGGGSGQCLPGTVGVGRAPGPSLSHGLFLKERKPSCTFNGSLCVCLGQSEAASSQLGSSDA